MIYPVVVIYNKKCEDSCVLNILDNYNKNHNRIFNVIVYDNSEIDLKNEVFCQKNKYIYLSNKKNDGLSVAYNNVINNIDFNDEDYIMILDDDTIINDTYLEEALNLTQEYNYDIIIPIVKAGKFILSPSIEKYVCGSRILKSVSEINRKKITAINSGMIVKRSVYDFVEYDEDLFLDLVDHQFIKDVKKFNFIIFVMKSEINQNYSRNEHNNIENDYNRFKIYKKDFKIYCTKNNARCFYFFSIFKLTVSYCIKYKTLRFLS